MPRTSTPRRLLPLMLCAACLGLALLATPVHAAKEPKKRVAVTAFENEAKNVPSELGDLGGGMAEKLAAALIATDKFVVLERQALADVLQEQNLKQVAPVGKPDQEGRLTLAQALIRGVITNVEMA